MYVPQCGKVCIEEICIGRRCASAGMHVKHAVCISINATAAHAAPKLRRAHSRCIPSGDWDTLIRTGGVVPEETFMLPCSPVMAHTIEVPPRMAVQLSRRKGSFFYWPLGLWPLFPRQVATAPPKLTGRLHDLNARSVLLRGIPRPDTVRRNTHGAWGATHAYPRPVSTRCASHRPPTRAPGESTQWPLCCMCSGHYFR